MNAKASLARSSQSGRSKISAALARAAIISPFQSAKTLSSRPGGTRSSRHGTARAAGRELGLERVAEQGRAVQPVEDGVALPIAVGRHVVMLLEERGARAEKGVDLGFAQT